MGCAWNVSLFWLWIMMAIVSIKCCIKAFLKIFQVAHGCDFFLQTWFSKSSTPSQCISIKEGEVWLLSNAVPWCFEFVCDGPSKKVYKHKSSELFLQVVFICWSFAHFKLMMSWLYFCPYCTLTRFSSFVDCIFYFAFLTLSLGSWLTC